MHGSGMQGRHQCRAQAGARTCTQRGCGPAPPAAACTMSAAVMGPPVGEQQEVSRSMAPFSRKICSGGEGGSLLRQQPLPVMAWAGCMPAASQLGSSPSLHNLRSRPARPPHLGHRQRGDALSHALQQATAGGLALPHIPAGGAAGFGAAIPHTPNPAPTPATPQLPAPTPAQPSAGPACLQDERGEDGGVKRAHSINEGIRPLQLHQHSRVGGGCHLVLVCVALCSGRQGGRRGVSSHGRGRAHMAARPQL